MTDENRVRRFDHHQIFDADGDHKLITVNQRVTSIHVKVVWRVPLKAIAGGV